MFKKILIGIVLCLSFLIFYVCSMLILIFSFETTVTDQTLAEADYIVVLGSRVYGEEPGPKLKERLDYTLALVPATDAKIIVSGGQGADEDVAEGDAMYKYLIENGVAMDRVIIEDKATSTWENLKFSKALMTGENPKVIVVTNDYHMFRVNMLANRLGCDWDVAGSPTAQPVKAIKREVFAIGKSFVFDH